MVWDRHLENILNSIPLSLGFYLKDLSFDLFLPHGTLQTSPQSSGQSSELHSPKSISAAICCRFLGTAMSSCSNATGILHSNFQNENPPELYTKA